MLSQILQAKATANTQWLAVIATPTVTAASGHNATAQGLAAGPRAVLVKASTNHEAKARENPTFNYPEKLAVGPAAPPHPPQCHQLPPAGGEEGSCKAS